MTLTRKILTLTLVILLLSSLFALADTSIRAQATSKPSTPQFSVKFIDNSYDVPSSTTTSIDPYTGKKITSTQQGYHVENMRIDVEIKNQLFTPYTNADGHECKGLFYRVQVKGHFETNWTTFSSRYPENYVSQSTSGYTVVSYTFHEYAGGYFIAKPSSGGQLDFRVEAFTGYWVEPTQIDHLGGFHDPTLFDDATSGWSSIQTITITYDSSSTKPSQTTNSSITSPSDSNNPQPQNPQQVLWRVIVFFMCIIAVLLCVIVYLLKQRKTSFLHDDAEV
jgi:hypothetical protein